MSGSVLYKPLLISQGYDTITACKNAINSLKANAPNENHFIFNKAKNGNFYFNIISESTGIIGTTRMYKTINNLRKSRDSIMEKSASEIDESLIDLSNDTINP